MSSINQVQETTKKISLFKRVGNWLKNLSPPMRILFSLVTSGFILLLPLLYTQNWLNGLGAFDSQNSANIGQTIGGITAPFVGLLGAFLLYQTLMAQLDESKKNEQSRVLDRFDKYTTEAINFISDARYTSTIGKKDEYHGASAIIQSFREQYQNTISVKQFQHALHLIAFVVENKSGVIANEEANFVFHRVNSIIRNLMSPIIISFYSIYLDSLENSLYLCQDGLFRSQSAEEVFSIGNEKKLTKELMKTIDTMKNERREKIKKYQESTDNILVTHWIISQFKMDLRNYYKILEKETSLLISARENALASLEEQKKSGHFPNEDEYLQRKEKIMESRKEVDSSREKYSKKKKSHVRDLSKFMFELISSFEKIRGLKN
jgi:hypothetical protein